MGPRQQAVSFYRRPISDQRVGGLRRRTRAVRPRRALRGRPAATIPTTRGGSRCSAAPRSNTCGSAASARRSSTRTTGRPASCRRIRRCCSRPTRSSAACRRSSRSTTSRSRESFRLTRWRQIGLASDVLHVEAMEFRGRISYLKSGHQFQRADHDGEPDLRARDPHAGHRLRLRRRPRTPGRRSGRASSTASTPTAGIRATDPFVPRATTAPTICPASGRRSGSCWRAEPGRVRRRGCDGRSSAWSPA